MLFRNQTYKKPQTYRMWSNKAKKSFISSPHWSTPCLHCWFCIRSQCLPSYSVGQEANEEGTSLVWPFLRTPVKMKSKQAQCYPKGKSTKNKNKS